MKISKYGHACLQVQEGEANILIDPGAFSQGFETITGLSAILITHQHADHVVPETLKKLLQANPQSTVYADRDTRVTLQSHGIQTSLASHGDSVEIQGLTIAFVGQIHAAIYQDFPGITNIGYFIGGRLFVPGDNFTKPDQYVEVLALPIGAPWLKVSEAIDYVVAVKPRIAIPVHDAVLTMPNMNIDIIKAHSKLAGTDFRVIENSYSITV